MYRRGFTLIELLVVIAIIGVLSAVVLASLNTSRMKTRDAARVASLREIEKAIELYYDDKGYYPGNTIGSYATTPFSGDDCGYNNDWCALETLLKPYIAALPRDTIGATLDRRFIYKSNAPFQMYALSVQLESTLPASANDGGYSASMFELGQLPAYCLARYSGASGNWNSWNSAQLCVGGN